MMKVKKIILIVVAITLSLSFGFTSFAGEEVTKEAIPLEEIAQTQPEKEIKQIETFTVYVYGKDNNSNVNEEFSSIKECFAWIKGKGLNGIIYSKLNPKKPLGIQLEGCEINIDSKFLLKYDSKKVVYDQKTAAVQKVLNSLGYKLKADGLFGKQTYEGIKLFQKAVHLEIDGVIGEKTLEKLANSYNEIKIKAKK